MIKMLITGIFEVGQKVLLQDKISINKLTPKWLGPFEVLEIDSTSKNVTTERKAKRPFEPFKTIL